MNKNGGADDKAAAQSLRGQPLKRSRVSRPLWIAKRLWRLRPLPSDVCQGLRSGTLNFGAFPAKRHRHVLGCGHSDRNFRQPVGAMAVVPTGCRKLFFGRVISGATPLWPDSYRPALPIRWGAFGFASRLRFAGRQSTSPAAQGSARQKREALPPAGG